MLHYQTHIKNKFEYIMIFILKYIKIINFIFFKIFNINILKSPKHTKTPINVFYFHCDIFFNLLFNIKMSR
jgi:hypothetical protein